MKKGLSLGIVMSLLIGAFVAGALLFNTGSAKIAYWEGRAKKSQEDLKVAEEAFKEAKKADARLQKKKDEKIEKLRKQATARRERVEEIDEVIAVTPVPEVAQSIVALYVEKVAKLEGIIANKDAEIATWEEKFDAKVALEVSAYLKRDLARQERIKELEKQVGALTRSYKSSKFWAKVGKGWSIYHGGKALYNALKGKI